MSREEGSDLRTLESNLSEAMGEAPEDTADMGDSIVARSAFENQDLMTPSASEGGMGALMKSFVRKGLLLACTTVYEWMCLLLRMMSLVVAAKGSLKTGVTMVGILVSTFLRVRMSLRV